MKNTRRVIAVLLAAVMCVLCFAACGKDATDTNTIDIKNAKTNRMRDKDYSFGVLPMPKYDEAQENLDKLFAKKRAIDQLSSEEHEYWDEMKACSDYCEEIPDHERRLLEKLRKLLGITEERAKEIEKL